MVIPCADIARDIRHSLESRVRALTGLRQSPKLLTILIGDAPDQQSYVRMKRSTAERLGVGFELLHLPQAPDFSEFLMILHSHAARSDVTGIIIQLPLPQGYDQEEIYAILPASKDLEGHHPDSHALFPLVQACGIGLNWVYSHTHSTQFAPDLPFVASEGLITWLRSQDIVVAGKGQTTGAPIGKYLDTLQIPYTQTDSQSIDPDRVYRTADIIITGVGKKIITRQSIKDRVILLNFGLHDDPRRGDDGRTRVLMGDYDEEEISDIASYYTPTPGGLGPIDILCLYANLIESAEESISDP